MPAAAESLPVVPQSPLDRGLDPAPPRGTAIEIGPLHVIPDEHIARVRGRALILSIRELRLLTELARRADRITARDELFRLAWGKEMRLGDRSVDVYVRRLRVKLERALPGWTFIHTHFGFGYRLTPEPSQVSDGPFTAQ